jgi:hypothetical protein
MKKLIAPLFALALVYSCSNSNGEKTTTDTEKKDTVALSYFGDTITAEGAVPAKDVMTKLAGKDSIQIKLEGTITDVCQKKGCWMALDLGNDKTMRVTFKDYGFFVPKDAGGKTAIVDGYAYVDTTSVAMLREYAKDGGASKDSIEKITQPEVELSFEARGVIIK